MGAFFPILVLGKLYLRLLFNLETGNTNPARAEADRPPNTFAVFPNFPVLLFLELMSLLATLLKLFTTGGITFDILDDFEAVVVGFDNAGATGLEAIIGAGTGAGGANIDDTGGLLSNNASGTLETVMAIDGDVYASFPLLSRVSRIVMVGNIENTFSRYPGNLETGLLIKSSCTNFFKPLNFYTCSNF
jgi:hypothetical protein